MPDDLDVYWQLSLDFLKIATEADGRKHLADNGLIEPAQRRDLLIAAEAKRLATQTGPVIAAGSTGSMPATARFLDAGGEAAARRGGAAGARHRARRDELEFDRRR